jgi:hypothetical protein
MAIKTVKKNKTLSGGETEKYNYMNYFISDYFYYGDSQSFYGQRGAGHGYFKT